MRLVEAAVNNNPRHRGDIDNRPAAGLQHQFRFRFAGVPYASEIDIDHPLPLLALHLQGRIGVGDPGGVNGDIEAAIAAFGQRDGGAQVGNLADIAVIRASLTADGFNMADRFRQPAVVAKIKTDYPRTRRHILVGVTAALLADEAALLLGMACTGQWNWSYLPLHLCSINVFVCLYNTLTDRSWCKEELYALCIPGAALALLCPSWRDVPGWFTLINLHSVSIHALLVLYPVLLVAGGYRPSVRRVPQVLAFLFGSALPIYFLNKPLHTNFYFLNNPYGNVITSTFTAWFGEKFYILGFLPAIALALVLMYAPWAAAGKKR